MRRILVGTLSAAALLVVAGAAAADGALDDLDLPDDDMWACFQWASGAQEYVCAGFNCQGQPDVAVMEQRDCGC